MRRAAALTGFSLAVALAAGAAGWVVGQDDSRTAAGTSPPTSSTDPAPGTTVATTAPGPPATTVPVRTTTGFLDLNGWRALMAGIPAPGLPSDCPLPLDDPASLPNSERSYRGGTHQGIDFICEERGRTAVAALPGRVVLANDTYVDATPEDRNALLAEAQALGRTPPWTLAFLFGRFVVLDHGVYPGTGHVVSVYAHLDHVDPAIRPGQMVEAGTPLGEIGNRGTDAGATGEANPRSLHLHWELYVDDVHLGSGLDATDTRTLYAELFRVP